MYKTGTGTIGLGHWDACVGTWDVGTRGEGRGDVWAGDAGTSNIGDAGSKVGGKCDISFFVKMCYLWSTLTAFDSK